MVLRDTQFQDAYYQAHRWNEAARNLADTDPDPAVTAAIGQSYAIQALAVALKDLAEATRGEQL